MENIFADYMEIAYVVRAMIMCGHEFSPAGLEEIADAINKVAHPVGDLADVILGEVTDQILSHMKEQGYAEYCAKVFKAVEIANMPK